MCHVSLNIFIFDKHNILVLQDITQPFAMDTAKQHLQANVLTWADNYSDIIFMENKSLAGSTFLQMRAGWKMSIQLSWQRLYKNFNQQIHTVWCTEYWGVPVYLCDCIHACIWVLVYCMLVCVRVCVWERECVIPWVHIFVSTWEICLTFICLSFSFIKPLVF